MRNANFLNHKLLITNCFYPRPPKGELPENVNTKRNFHYLITCFNRSKSPLPRLAVSKRETKFSEANLGVVFLTSFSISFNGQFDIIYKSILNLAYHQELSQTQSSLHRATNQHLRAHVILLQNY